MLLLLSLLSCDPVPNADACLDFSRLQCETCELEGLEKTWCTCIENGTLTQDDFPDESELTDQDAEIECSAFLYSLQYPGPSQAAGCRQSLEYLKEWENEGCPKSREEEEEEEGDGDPSEERRAGTIRTGSP